MHIDSQAIWLYFITGGLWFFALDVNNRRGGEALIYRIFITALWPLFLVTCIVKKL